MFVKKEHAFSLRFFKAGRYEIKKYKFKLTMK